METCACCSPKEETKHQSFGKSFQYQFSPHKKPDWKASSPHHYRKHDLYEYVGTQTDDLLVVGLPGSLDAIIAKLSETFTIKSLEEPMFHLGCDYKAETISVEIRAPKKIRKLKQGRDLLL